jgi:hypothetical protein
MVVNLATASIIGAALTAGLMWPLIGWPALLCAPFGGSALAFAVAVRQGRLPEQTAMLPEDEVDQMVADLKRVLARARRWDDEMLDKQEHKAEDVRPRRTG